MLVHVERQDGNAAGEALRVVGGTLIDQPAISGHVGKQNPPRVADQGLGQANELLPPMAYRAKISGDGVGDDLGKRSPVIAKAREIEFVQEGRVKQID